LGKPGSLPIAGVEFKHQEFVDKSLEDLISIGNKGSIYQDQAVLILHQVGGPSWKKTPYRPSVDPYEVDRIIQIDRNPSGQIYIAPDLNTSCHLAASKDVSSEIAHRIKFFYGPCPQSPVHTHVSCDTNYNEFLDEGIFVHNVDSSDNTGSNRDGIQKLFSRVCDHGIFSNLKFTEKQRSSGEIGESPVLHFGFSKSNCNQYPGLRTTQFGHVSAAPIMSGINKISEECKGAILKLINAAELMCPEGHNTFLVENENEYRIQYRVNLNKSFGTNLDPQTGVPFDDGEPFMTCEGFTIIIPLILTAHRDFLNDFIKGEIVIFKLLHLNLKLSNSYS
jgi:hypothetical protein